MSQINEKNFSDIHEFIKIFFSTPPQQQKTQDIHTISTQNLTGRDHFDIISSIFLGGLVQLVGSSKINIRLLDDKYKIKMHMYMQSLGYDYVFCLTNTVKSEIQKKMFPFRLKIANIYNQVPIYCVFYPI